MKYRAAANGNLVEDVHPSLVEAGIYEPVEEPASPAGSAKPMTTTNTPGLVKRPRQTG